MDHDHDRRLLRPFPYTVMDETQGHLNEDKKDDDKPDDLVSRVEAFGLFQSKPISNRGSLHGWRVSPTELTLLYIVPM